MYKRLIIIPYKMGSTTCKALKEALVAAGVRCFRKTTEQGFVPHPKDIVLYYGGTRDLAWPHPHKTLNLHRTWAQNKLLAFQRMKENNLSTVEWTTDKAVAATWPVVVERAILTGHSGKGITICDQEANPLRVLADVPLYTKYMKKTFECRIHVFNGSVIDAQIKKRKQGAEDVNNYVRNIHTGWVYCRDGYNPSEAASRLAIDAINALDLDFGAVDLIYNQHYDKYYILEVNTAPGLEGTTLTKYVQAIKQLMEH